MLFRSRLLAALRLTRAVHTVGSLLLGTVSDGGPQADDCGLVLLLARFSDRVIN